MAKLSGPKCRRSGKVTNVLRLKRRDSSGLLPQFNRMAVYQQFGATLGLFIVEADDIETIPDVSVRTDDVRVISNRLGYVGALSPGERSHSLM